MVLLPGELHEDGERGPTTLAMPGGSTRTIVLRLLPNGYQQRKLVRLADASARLWNEVNYERRRQFFEQKKVDLKGTYKKYYEKYKRVLGPANTQALLQKNNEAWSAFFSLLKNRKKLPPFMRHIAPPSYWKEDGRRKLILVVRQDRYVIDEERRVLILKDWRMEIPFAGRLRWSGVQGRLEIHIEDGRFYAHIPVDVGRTTSKRTGKPMKDSLIIHGERDKVQVASPLGNRTASIDLGINMLATVVVDDGTVLFYRGSIVKSDYFYFQRRIAELDRMRALAEETQFIDAVEEVLRERRRVFRKLRRRLLHYYRTLASHLAKTLWRLGVSTVYLGYPYLISQDKGSKFTVNLWSYRKLIEAIVNKLHEYGMKVFLVLEYSTSRLCAFHNVEVVRNPRGVVTCPLGHRLHSDINGALNIMKLGIGRVANALRKPLSFLVSSNGVTPTKGGNAQDPSKTPPHRRGKGSEG